MTVRVLSADLASQIAAGEVVERPASVVKELVENALDAQATRVTVTIAAGGLDSIEVADNGVGISPADAELCLFRHATSKLYEFSQLESLVSYGFRGEALPSIASVSRLTLRSRVAGDDEGVQLSAAGTTQAHREPVGHPVGTTVRVDDLFYNVPARRKFLRSSNTESGHVAEVVLDAALSRPDVSFSLLKDGRKIRNFERTSHRAQRVQQAFDGADLFGAQTRRGPLDVELFLAGPGQARRGAGGLKLIVNGRPVRDRALSATIAHAYGRHLERGRYPRGAVYLTIDPRLVDINVHPQKSEIRFAELRAVSDAVYSAVAGLVARHFEGAGEDDLAKQAPSSPPPRADSARSNLGWLSGQQAPWGGQHAPSLRDGRRLPALSGRPPKHEPAASEKGGAPTFRGLSFLRQLRQCYLLCENSEGLCVLDQHVAEELVLFSQLQAASKTGAIASQPLLFPARLSVQPAQGQWVERHGEQLETFGLDVRLRSESELSIHTLPRGVQTAHPGELLLRLISLWEGRGESALEATRPHGSAQEAVLAQLACAGATSPGQSMSEQRAHQLLTQLASLDSEAPCLHRRLVLWEDTYAAWDKKAGRG